MPIVSHAVYHRHFPNQEQNYFLTHLIESLFSNLNFSPCSTYLQINLHWYSVKSNLGWIILLKLRLLNRFINLISSWRKSNKRFSLNFLQIIPLEGVFFRNLSNMRLFSLNFPSNHPIVVIHSSFIHFYNKTVFLY